MNRRLLLLPLFVMLLIGTGTLFSVTQGPAHAADPVSVQVAVRWDQIIPTSGLEPACYFDTGGSSPRFYWGSSSFVCPASPNDVLQSYYQATPRAPFTAAPGETFPLLVFEHQNQPNGTSPTLLSADLVLDLTADGQPLSLVTRLTLDETTNVPVSTWISDPEACPYDGAYDGSVLPCSDAIRFATVDGEGTVEIGGVPYTLAIVGFVGASSDGTCLPDTPLQQLITNERLQNYACLVGELVEVPTLTITKQIVGDPAPAGEVFDLRWLNSLPGSVDGGQCLITTDGVSSEYTCTFDLPVGIGVTVLEEDPGENWTRLDLIQDWDPADLTEPGSAWNATVINSYTAPPPPEPTPTEPTPTEPTPTEPTPTEPTPTPQVFNWSTATRLYSDTRPDLGPSSASASFEGIAGEMTVIVTVEEGHPEYGCSSSDGESAIHPRCDQNQTGESATVTISGPAGELLSITHLDAGPEVEARITLPAQGMTATAGTYNVQIDHIGDGSSPNSLNVEVAVEIIG